MPPATNIAAIFECGVISVFLLTVAVAWRLPVFGTAQWAYQYGLLVITRTNIMDLSQNLMSFLDRADSIAKRLERFVAGSAPSDPLYVTNRTFGQKLRVM